jgi:hypothetical protein
MRAGMLISQDPGEGSMSLIWESNPNVEGPLSKNHFVNDRRPALRVAGDMPHAVAYARQKETATRLDKPVQGGNIPLE